MKPFPVAVESLLITLDKASRDLLIFDPSLRRIPSAYVLETPSEPAKSTRLS